MDELDLVQEAASVALEELLSERRKKAEVEALIQPPAARDCKSCGCEIPMGRLKLRPTTRHCVDCQNEFEGIRA